MVLRRPGRNRSWHRENPDILIMMIAVDQIIRGREQDKGDGTERKGMGPLKPATKGEWFCTQEQLSSFLFLSLSLHPPGFLLCGCSFFFFFSYLVGPFPPSPPTCRVLFWPLETLFLPFNGSLRWVSFIFQSCTFFSFKVCDQRLRSYISVVSKCSKLELLGVWALEAIPFSFFSCRILNHFFLPSALCCCDLAEAGKVGIQHQSLLFLFRLFFL